MLAALGGNGQTDVDHAQIGIQADFHFRGNAQALQDPLDLQLDHSRRPQRPPFNDHATHAGFQPRHD